MLNSQNKTRTNKCCYCSVKRGPSLDMFEVSGRTGPQNLGGGAQFWTLKFCINELANLNDFNVEIMVQTQILNYSCCHQVRFASTQCSQMRLRPGLCPDPAGGAYSAHRPLADFKRDASQYAIEMAVTLQPSDAKFG